MIELMHYSIVSQYKEKNIPFLLENQDRMNCRKRMYCSLPHKVRNILCMLKDLNNIHNVFRKFQL